jgi:hypothetical protein
MDMDSWPTSRQTVSFDASWTRTSQRRSFARSMCPFFGRCCPESKRRPSFFFQLDRRISMMIDVQLTSRLPLVQSQE